MRFMGCEPMMVSNSGSSPAIFLPSFQTKLLEFSMVSPSTEGLLLSLRKTEQNFGILTWINWAAVSLISTKKAEHSTSTLGALLQRWEQMVISSGKSHFKQMSQATKSPVELSIN